MSRPADTPALTAASPRTLPVGPAALGRPHWARRWPGQRRKAEALLGHGEHRLVRDAPGTGSAYAAVSAVLLR